MVRSSHKDKDNTIEIMDTQKKHIINRIRISFIMLILMAAFFFIDRHSLLKMFDNRLFDVFHVVEGVKEPPKHVAIVEIDNRTFLKLKNEPMVFWGPHFARVISVLKKAGVRAIGIDTFFSVSIESWFGRFGESYEEQSRMYDIDFRRALAEGGITLVCMFINIEDRARMQLPVDEYVYSLPGGLNDLGIANLIYDNDGIIRRFTHSYFEDEAPPHLSFASSIAKKHLSGEIEPDLNSGFSNIYFFGPPGTFPSISFSRFLEDGAQDDPQLGILKGRSVIIALGNDTKQDLQLTPYSTRFLNFPGRMMPGGEVHANILETIISKKIPRELQAFEKIIFLFIFSLFSSVIFLKSSIPSGVLDFFILTVINVLAAYLFFKRQIYVPATAALLIIISNYISMLGMKFTREEKEKARIKNIFGHLVSPDVVNSMIESGESPSLGGEMKEVTVLFSDIRNFTTITEMLEPYEVVEMLNRYFSIICAQIMNLKGTVDKFIGDAIMVIFGSPLYYEGHAKSALKAALLMDAEAKKFRVWMKERFGDKYKELPEFNIGIGIHCGNAIIGNIGSEKRFEFTAIGDTVNIASRLEGLSKKFDSNIIVTRNILDTINDEVITGRSETVKVKGKNVAIEVVEFIGFKESETEAENVS